MWIRSKKTMLAIEWVWLLIGTAAVFAHLVEAWASPYLPAVWMLGVLGLFLIYRLGMAVREVYWPEPEPDPKVAKQPYEAATRRGGDGIVSTTEWVLPQIRGRKARLREQLAALDPPQSAKPPPSPVADADKTADQLELPSASGRFEDAEVATVFAAVDEDTEPQSTDIVDVGIPFQATSIVRVDKADLRPETEADMSQEEIVIPSFAESALTGDERNQVIEAVRRGEVTSKRPRPQPPTSADDETSPIRVSDDDTDPIRLKGEKHAGSDEGSP
jgi:hypothetical protein